ncbi:hypothetical protein IQ22_00689 [Pseudomonas duriflava]|uniref:DUF6970 domain-containing protein n=1 Tax=Pseudomonas duriflava TaxID=459528 RepID=A0A562QL35_9PSED|nr:hypothetical protein [Pseudomonas duriflava]TWI57472.1 hypothetical protein IQ22_00689 [Pseudomonas duriflava]
MRLLLAAWALTLSACTNSASLDAPRWLEAKIIEFGAQPPANPPRSIWRSELEGKTVYYISPACCDIPSELYDANGKLLCYPSGSLIGFDVRCPTFVSGRPRLEPVWQDFRTSP